MITKILFTIAVIGAVFLFLGKHSRSSQKKSLTMPEQVRPPAPLISPRFARVAAYATIGTMILASALFAYREWDEAHRVVNLRVINVSTGEMVTYRAHKGDVEGRRFLTLDGRMVTLAEVERMELVGQR